MPHFKGTERRQFIRIPFWFITKYRIYPYNIEESAVDFRHGIGKNISVGGICFEAEDNFKSDTVLEVELDMPALDHAVKIIGQIAWAKQKENDRHYVYGLVFTKIRPEDVESVKAIIDTFS